MSKLILSLGFLTTVLCAYTQNSSSNDYFKVVTYISEIKSSDKNYIFLFATTKTCAACVKMEKITLANDTVFSYLTSTFATYKVYLDSTVDEGLKSLLNVNCYPSFIIMDSNHQMIHKFTGYKNTHDFILNCSQYSTENSLSSTLHKYKNGNRDNDFLYDLCINLKIANELDSFFVNEYLNSLLFEDLSLDKTMEFIAFNSIINYKSTINTKSRVYRSMIENKEKYYEKFGKENFEQLLVWLIYNEIIEKINTNNYNEFINVLNLLKEFDNKYETCFLRNEQNEILGIINSSYMIDYLNFYNFDKNGTLKQKEESLRNYLNVISKDSDKLDDFARGIYYEFKEIEKLKLAEKCVKKSIKIKKTSSNEITCSYILNKLENRKGALRHMKKAMKLGATEEEIAELMNQINN